LVSATITADGTVASATNFYVAANAEIYSAAAAAFVTDTAVIVAALEDVAVAAAAGDSAALWLLRLRL
jgi:hypothetical protein